MDIGDGDVLGMLFGCLLRRRLAWAIRYSKWSHENTDPNIPPVSLHAAL